MIQPLYRKLYAAYYQPLLSDRDRIALSRRAGILLKQQRRAAARHPPFPDVIIYTDAATGAMIMASIVISRPAFLTSQRISFCGGIRASGDWAVLFSETSLIYGIELTALVLTVMGPQIPSDNCCIAFYVDNSCALSAIAKVDCFRTAISVLARLFWAACAIRGITPWVELADSNVNISDIPTRGAALPFSSDTTEDFLSGGNF